MGTCTVAEILVAESNHMFLAYLDPKNVLSDTENKPFQGDLHVVSTIPKTLPGCNVERSNKRRQGQQKSEEPVTPLFLCLLMHGIDSVLPVWPKWRLYPKVQPHYGNYRFFKFTKQGRFS